MELHFENLSFVVILFYAVVAAMFAGVTTLVTRYLSKIILRHFVKMEFNWKRVFITSTLLLFIFFMIATLLDHPYES